MARNASGTHSLPTGNPVVSGTAISSTVQNATMSDISTEITDSLSRSGKGGMTAPLRCADGAVSAPAHSYTSETNSGFYRAGASDVRLAIAGTDRYKQTATGATFTGTLTSTGAGSFAGAAMNGAKVTGVADPADAQDADTLAARDAAIAAGSRTQVTLTFGSGWTATSSSVYRAGKVVAGSVIATDATAVAWTIATLPTGARPSVGGYWVGQVAAGGVTNALHVSVNSSGEITAAFYDNGTSLTAMGANVAGTVVTISFSFTVA